MDDPEEIYVLNKRLRLLHPAGSFSTSLDSVMLAAACPAQSGDHVLDLGCGVGGAGLCVLARVPGARLTGIDIQADQIEMATRNAQANNMEGRVEFIASDVRKFKDGAFDHVICNPPYYEAEAHTRSPSPAKALAMGHEETSLQDWLDAGNARLKHGGGLSIIHTAGHIDALIKGLKNRFGAVEIIPLWPKAGQSAKRVIVRAVRNSKSPARLHPGLTLHQENGDYTREAENILRSMGAID